MFKQNEASNEKQIEFQNGTSAVIIMLYTVQQQISPYVTFISLQPTTNAKVKINIFGVSEQNFCLS